MVSEMQRVKVGEGVIVETIRNNAVWEVTLAIKIQGELLYRIRSAKIYRM